jgi:hypothetical protein
MELLAMTEACAPLEILAILEAVMAILWFVLPLINVTLQEHVILLMEHVLHPPSLTTLLAMMEISAPTQISASVGFVKDQIPPHALL